MPSPSPSTAYTTPSHACCAWGKMVASCTFLPDDTSRPPLVTFRFSLLLLLTTLLHSRRQRGTRAACHTTFSYVIDPPTTNHPKLAFASQQTGHDASIYLASSPPIGSPLLLGRCECVSLMKKKRFTPSSFTRSRTRYVEARALSQLSNLV